MNYRTQTVPVRGGDLYLGIWESDDVVATGSARHTILAVHGVTSSHLAWALIAANLTCDSGVRIVAPDLRGRGHSAGLPGPWGMRTHADDLSEVVAAIGIPTVVVGHSMGGFVVVVHAARHAAGPSRILLVDGGVPLELPTGVRADAALAAALGPAAERLHMLFADHEEHRQFWRRHPAFASDWSAALERYLDYDLVEAAGGWRSRALYAAVVADSAELGGDGIVAQSWDRLSQMPVFLRSPLGLLAQTPGLYPSEVLARFASAHSRFTWSDVVGTNHYTLTLGELGASRVAQEITRIAALPVAVTASGQPASGPSA